MEDIFFLSLYVQVLCGFLAWASGTGKVWRFFRFWAKKWQKLLKTGIDPLGQTVSISGNGTDWFFLVSGFIRNDDFVLTQLLWVCALRAGPSEGSTVPTTWTSSTTRDHRQHPTNVFGYRNTSKSPERWKVTAHCSALSTDDSAGHERMIYF